MAPRVAPPALCPVAICKAPSALSVRRHTTHYPSSSPGRSSATSEDGFMPTRHARSRRICCQAGTVRCYLCSPACDRWLLDTACCRTPGTRSFSCCSTAAGPTSPVPHRAPDHHRPLTRTHGCTGGIRSDHSSPPSRPIVPPVATASCCGSVIYGLPSTLAHP